MFWILRPVPPRPHGNALLVLPSVLAIPFGMTIVCAAAIAVQSGRTRTMSGLRMEYPERSIRVREGTEREDPRARITRERVRRSLWRPHIKGQAPCLGGQPAV